MLKLHAKVETSWEGEPQVLRVSTDAASPPDVRGSQALLVTDNRQLRPTGFGAYLTIGNQSAHRINCLRHCNLPKSMGYLGDGDIVRISPVGRHLSVLYRRSSRFNSMLLTERCNSNCIMCSQPPKKVDDHYLVDAYLQAIPMMDQTTAELGITGGEPTLLGQRFLDVVVACKANLPHTALHILSNGRMFNYLSLCRDLACIKHSDLVIGIPLYSDIAWQHDFIVQARGAFDQTLRGMMNLARCNVRVELRVVIERQTVSRLPQLAQFIVRNLPFIEHVALMGLEVMGFARPNLGALWVDPAEYQPTLKQAIDVLVRHRMNPSIYNHQLCTLDRALWPYARKSISDWKNEYLPTCSSCAVRDDCGGFFASSATRHSAHIRPISAGCAAEKLN